MTGRRLLVCVVSAAALLLLAPAAPDDSFCAWAQYNNKNLPPAPKPEKSDLLSSELFSFSIEKEGEAFVARYTLSVVPNRPLQKELFLQVKFENPADKDAPLVVQQTLKPSDERAMLISPAISSLKCGLYRVEVSIFDSEKRENSVGTHQQMFRSTYDLSKIKKPKDLESLSKC
jgi:hypothetical protein